jgi:hypothetical protein
MVDQVVIDPSLGLLSPCEGVPWVLILISLIADWAPVAWTKQRPHARVLETMHMGALPVPGRFAEELKQRGPKEQ